MFQLILPFQLELPFEPQQAPCAGSPGFRPRPLTSTCGASPLGEGVADSHSPRRRARQGPPSAAQ